MEEIFDIVDENGEPTGKTVPRSEAHRNGIRHRTAHVWLWRPAKGGFEILLQKRSDDKDSFPGCYDISSAGHIPAGCDYITSALRELKEELGLTARSEDLVPVGSKSLFTEAEFYGEPFRDNQFTRFYRLEYRPEMGDIIPQPEEIESVRWFTPDGIRALYGKPESCVDPAEIEKIIESIESIERNKIK